MIDHLSQTMIGMWERCQVQFQYRYLDGLILPPGLAAHIGTGTHKGAEVNQKAKLITGKDEPLSVVQDAARDGYMRALQKNGVFFPPSEAASAKRQMAEGIDITVGLAKTYLERVAPEIKPKHIELKLTLDHKEIPVPFTGIIDLVTAENELRDLKTSSKRWAQSRADTSIQATLYNELVGRYVGAYPNRIVFDVLVKGKDEPQALETTRNGDDFAALIERVKAMLRGIEAGAFYPASRDSWLCSEQWCGYFQMCKYAKGRATL